ncbi:MAG: iron-sulfur cluster assembly scaffold protein [Vicinamibacterales bacterium]
MRHSDEVLARARRPERVGAFPPGPDVGTGEAGSLDEGTMARIQVRVDGTRVTAAVFKVFGCSAAIASASLVAERLDGAPLEGARRLAGDDIATALALAPERRHVAALAVDAAQRALDDWERRQGAAGGAAPGTDA